jgi:hypothetical protein
MFTVKRYFFIVTLCFLTTLLSSRYLWSKEELKKTPSDQQKSVIKQKHLPTLTIKGAKIKTVPAKRASELQKVESKQEQAPTENQPQISLDSNHYDLGEVWEGDEIAHTFTVKNTGTAQLNIKNVGAG